MKHAVVSILASAGLALVALYSGLAQEENGRYYPETGHVLGAQFVEFFDAHGGVEILGYPITDAFEDPLTGRVVQYTENSRLEVAPDGVGSAGQVRLTPLGEELGGRQTPSENGQRQIGPVPGCRFYSETRHNVCHAFLEFYVSHGGPGLFGCPISEFTLEDSRIVQYFQAFRLDWYPEETGGGRVRIAPLGREHFEAMGYDSALLRPRLPSDMQFYQVTELRPQASVWQSVLGSSGVQQIYLVVRDQNFNPIPGAAAAVTAHFPDGDRIVVMPLTDNLGVSRLTLVYEGVSPGSIVGLEFWVVYGGLQTTTRDSFRVWW